MWRSALMTIDRWTWFGSRLTSQTWTNAPTSSQSLSLTLIKVILALTIWSIARGDNRLLKWRLHTNSKFLLTCLTYKKHLDSWHIKFQNFFMIYWHIHICTNSTNMHCNILQKDRDMCTNCVILLEYAVELMIKKYCIQRTGSTVISVISYHITIYMYSCFWS